MSSLLLLSPLFSHTGHEIVTTSHLAISLLTADVNVLAFEDAGFDRTGSSNLVLICCPEGRLSLSGLTVNARGSMISSNGRIAYTSHDPCVISETLFSRWYTTKTLLGAKAAILGRYPCYWRVSRYQACEGEGWTCVNSNSGQKHF